MLSIRYLRSAAVDMLAYVACQQSLTGFPPTGRRKTWAVYFAVFSAMLLVILGCSPGTSSGSSQSRAQAQQARKAARSEEDKARQELEQIPPPSKNQYLGVRSKDAYSNPFLVVHPQMVTLSIIFPDENPAGFESGSMLRPAKARRQETDVHLSDLAEALASLPPEVWPYGRVVAIEESPGAPRAERVAIRRNIEAAIQTLNDLGVVVDEWTGLGGSLR